jgi:hypothetical protein
MKKISFLLALVAGLAAQLALAGAAIVTQLNGTAQVQSGTAAARTLRQGDEVNQGDTVSTGANSGVVLKFDDGEVATLTANSRMTVTQYQYNAQSGSGNIQLSLVNGGMRAVTGLIGKNSPDKVTYRAGAATIGIRGTTVDIVASEGKVSASVEAGEISFTMGSETHIVPTGQAVYADGKITQASAQAIFDQLPQNMRDLIGNLHTLMVALNEASGATSGTGRINAVTGTSSTGGGGSSVSPSTSKPKR